MKTGQPDIYGRLHKPPAQHYYRLPTQITRPAVRLGAASRSAKGQEMDAPRHLGRQAALWAAPRSEGAATSRGRVSWQGS
jgi:hypothetical protein